MKRFGVNVHEIATGGIGTPKGVGLPGCVHPKSVVLNARIFVDTWYQKIFLCAVRCSVNQPPKSAGDWYSGILKITDIGMFVNCNWVDTR